jgi:15-cis-phytoene synthase
VVEEDGSPAADGIAVLAASARSREPDRYLAALLALAQARNGLLALAAFSAELANVPRLVRREAAMGEIRLQWWRDALERPHEQRTGNPVADALREAMVAHALPRARLDELIDARVSDIRADTIVDDEALHRYLWKTEGTLFALAARVIDPGTDPRVEAAARASGDAYGLARVLVQLPTHLSRQRIPLPLARLVAAGIAPDDLLRGDGSDKIEGLLADLRAEARVRLVAARQHVAQLSPNLRAAFLPLALVESYLRALERQRGNPLRQETGIAPVTRIARIAMGHWLGRI